MSGDAEPDICGECFEEFRYDDTGGYNPPCECGCGLCRSCHRENARQEEAEADDE